MIPTDIYLLPSSFSFTLGVLSIFWPDVLKEFAWLQYRLRTVKALAKVQVVVGIFCWAARDYCWIATVAAVFSISLLVSGSFALAVPSAGLRSLRLVLLARPKRIRIVGVALVLLSFLLLLATRPRPPFFPSAEVIATDCL